MLPKNWSEDNRKAAFAIASNPGSGNTWVRYKDIKRHIKGII